MLTFGCASMNSGGVQSYSISFAPGFELGRSNIIVGGGGGGKHSQGKRGVLCCAK